MFEHNYAHIFRGFLIGECAHEPRMGGLVVHLGSTCFRKRLALDLIRGKRSQSFCDICSRRLHHNAAALVNFGFSEQLKITANTAVCKRGIVICDGYGRYIVLALTDASPANIFRGKCSLFAPAVEIRNKVAAAYFTDRNELLDILG